MNGRKMKLRLFMSMALMVVLFSSAFLLPVPNLNKAHAQLADDVFLKSITRISGGSVFNSPLSIALDPSENIYVADSGNYRVAKLDNSGTFIAAFGTSGPGELNTTSGVAVDTSGNVYAVDSDNNQIVEFSSSGAFVKSFGSGTLSSPSGVAVDTSGNVYVTDSDNNQIVEFSDSGTFIQSFGTQGGLLLSLPSNVALNSDGHIFVADQGNNRILVFDSTGNFLYCKIMETWFLWQDAHQGLRSLFFLGS